MCRSMDVSHSLLSRHLISHVLLLTISLWAMDCDAELSHCSSHDKDCSCFSSFLPCDESFKPGEWGGLRIHEREFDIRVCPSGATRIHSPKTPIRTNHPPCNRDVSLYLRLSTVHSNFVTANSFWIRVLMIMVKHKITPPSYISS